MENIKHLSRKIADSLESVAPKGTVFVVIYAVPNDDAFEITSNLTDESALMLLNKSIKSIKETEPMSLDLPDEDIN